MAKKQTKDLIRKPDFLLQFIENAYIFIQENLRGFIIGAVIFVLAVASVYGYAVYARKQEEKSQTTLFQGIKSFEEYSQGGKQESLTNAENVFQTLIKEKKVRHIRLPGFTWQPFTLYRENQMTLRCFISK